MIAHITVEAEAYIDDFDDDDLLAEVTRRKLDDRLPPGLRTLVADGLREIHRGHFDHGVTLIQSAMSAREINPKEERKKYDAAMAAKREATHVQLAA